VTACLQCLPGYSCQTEALSFPVTLCAEGFACREGNYIQHPSKVSTERGEICSPGHYCQAGVSIPQDCPAGYYCEEFALGAVSGPCKAGYYCPLGSTVAANLMCPAGHYCEDGSSEPKECPVGTYTVSKGASSLSHCIDCPFGKYCDTGGLEDPVLDCAAGYYCPPGQSQDSSVAYKCPVGNECP